MNELKVYEDWKENRVFERTLEANSSKPTYVFYDGPPFATGLPHYGHITAGFIKDTVLRYAHEKGFSVPRFAGFDVHGLPIEFEIEKELGIKTTQQVLEYGIANYNDKCKSIVLRYSGEWKEIMGRLGRWIDFEHQYTTMTKEFMNSVWWVFSELYKKNRIYSGVKIMPYSTSCGTPLSNFETQQNFKEIADDSLFIKLPINIPGYVNTWILVWTTTPWTLPSNYALCVNPNIVYDIVEIDGSNYLLAKDLVSNVFKKQEPKIIASMEGKDLVGLSYTPAFTLNTLVNISDYKIISGDFVTATDGTGVVHIAPAFGLDDYNICIEKGIINKESKLFCPLDINGYISEDIPELKGMFYKNNEDKSKIDFNTWVILQLKQSGYYMEKRQIIHKYPFCWRSDTPLIYRAVSSWFVKVEDIKERLVELNKEINWVPGHIGSARFSNWLETAKDWGISRNRFWGTPIPIWQSPDGDTICVSSSYELEELVGMEPGSITDLHRQHIDHIIINKDGKEFRRVDTVLDCWFESGSMPYGTINQVGIVELLRNSITGIELDEKLNPFIKTNDNKIHKILPADFIAEGLDQTRGWFYTLLVLSASLFNTIPFKNVIVNGLVLAEDGKKMSKRLKNYPDPMEIVNTYGSDCLRLYLLGSPVTKAEALKFSKQGVHNMMKDVIIPLSNSMVFFQEYANLYFKQKETNLIYSIKENIYKITNPINCWILYQYNIVINEFNKFMGEYDLNRAVSVLPKLVEILNNGYIKFGRLLLKGKDTDEEWSQSLSTLYYLLKNIMIDFRSVIPFFCETLYTKMKEFSKLIGHEDLVLDLESTHLINKLEYTYIELSSIQLSQSNDFDIIYNMIEEIYKLRGINNISLKKPIKSISLVIDEDLETKYSSRFREWLGFVSDECNIMELNIIPKEEINIIKSIVPVKALFFKKYGKEVAQIFNELGQMNSLTLEEIIKVGEYKGFEVNRTLFNINSSIEFVNNSSQKNLAFSEYKFDNFNIIVIGNLDWDETTDKLYYYRLVATKIQKARKLAGLHPWDPITSYYYGNPKYTLDEDTALNFINDITRIKLLQYQNQTNTINYEFEDIGLTIHLERN